MVQISNNTAAYKLHSISLQMFTWSFMAHADILRGGGQRDITLIMLHIIQQGDIPLITQGILFTHSNKKIIKNIFLPYIEKKKNAKTMSQTSVMWSAQTSANKLEKNKISMNEILLVTFQARLLHYQADVFHITAVCFHFYSVRNLVTNPSRIRKVLLILNLNGKECHKCYDSDSNISMSKKTFRDI